MIEWYISHPVFVNDTFQEGLKIIVREKSLSINKNLVEKIGSYVLVGYDTEKHTLVFKPTKDTSNARKFKEGKRGGTLPLGSKIVNWLKEHNVKPQTLEVDFNFAGEYFESKPILD
jgi:D-arabinose 1-dehydrogenase-like Zn-dependent alcohol dehydrogenase